MALTSRNLIIFWKTVIRTFRLIYVNCFNRLRFLAEANIKLQKMYFFGQFKDYNSERKHGNWTNDPIFSSNFSALLFQSQSPSFCCPLFSENYLNSQARIKKIVNKHTVYYHPNPSQLIWRIHTLVFLWTPKGFISPRIFLDFFPKPVYSTMVMEKFQIYSVRITANTFMSKNWMYSILPMPPSKTLRRFYHYPPARRELPISPE